MAVLFYTGEKNPMLEVYNTCLTRFGTQHRHIAMIDSDEVSSIPSTAVPDLVAPRPSGLLQGVRHVQLQLQDEIAASWPGSWWTQVVGHQAWSSCACMSRSPRPA